MSEDVRAFVAIELPDHIKAALSGLSAKLGQLRISGVRPVSPDSVHLTLKFLGSVPKDRIESIAECVRHVASRHPRFALDFSGPGVFPSRQRPRVLWVGIGGDLPSLLSLHQRAEEALRELGFARERREFSPHLTVARLKDRTAPIDGQRAVEALLSAREFESGLGMNVESVSLMRSVLLPDGARHQRLASMPLADDSAQVAPG